MLKKVQSRTSKFLTVFYYSPKMFFIQKLFTDHTSNLLPRLLRKSVFTISFSYLSFSLITRVNRQKAAGLKKRNKKTFDNEQSGRPPILLVHVHDTELRAGGTGEPKV